MYTKLLNKIMAIESDQFFNKWIIDSGRLDHDIYVLERLRLFLGNGNIVDIGANIGTHTIFYFNNVKQNKKVYAFEPNPMAYECLRYNCPEVIHFPLALGEIVRTSKLKINLINPGASFIDEESDLTIPVVEFDRFLLSDISFIKIDVEGFEWFVLMGSIKTILNSQPNIWIELSPHQAGRNGKTIIDVIHIFRNLSYSPLYVYGDSKQADVLFVPNSRLSYYSNLCSSLEQYSEYSEWLKFGIKNREEQLINFFRI